MISKITCHAIEFCQNLVKDCVQLLKFQNLLNICQTNFNQFIICLSAWTSSQRESTGIIGRCHTGVMVTASSAQWSNIKIHRVL